MLDVYLTVDVEIWCNRRDSLDAAFPDAFQRYIHGPTAAGNYGLPYILKVLQDHGLKGVFFVEPLFSCRFGLEPLAEIVGLIRDGQQEIQLHLHTEWVGEAKEALLPSSGRVGQHLRHFPRDEQKTLIAKGGALLEEAGGGTANAFRAGSFGFNVDTLHALGDLGFVFDSSYNASLMGIDSGLMPGTKVCEPLLYNDVFEYPMTVFYDRPGHLRHAQIGACSFREMEGLLWQGLELERKAFVILSHSFELLNVARNRADGIVVDRFRKLCEFLDRNRDCFRTCGFAGRTPEAVSTQPAPMNSPLWKTGLRVMEQVYRRRFR